LRVEIDTNLSHVLTINPVTTGTMRVPTLVNDEKLVRTRSKSGSSGSSSSGRALAGQNAAYAPSSSRGLSPPSNKQRAAFLPLSEGVLRSMAVYVNVISPDVISRSSRSSSSSSSSSSRKRNASQMSSANASAVAKAPKPAADAEAEADKQTAAHTGKGTGTGKEAETEEEEEFEPYVHNEEGDDRGAAGWAPYPITREGETLSLGCLEGMCAPWIDDLSTMTRHFLALTYDKWTYPDTCDRAVKHPVFNHRKRIMQNIASSLIFKHNSLAEVCVLAVESVLRAQAEGKLCRRKLLSLDTAMLHHVAQHEGLRAHTRYIADLGFPTGAEPSQRQQAYIRHLHAMRVASWVLPGTSAELSVMQSCVDEMKKEKQRQALIESQRQTALLAARKEQMDLEHRVREQKQHEAKVHLNAQLAAKQLALQEKAKAALKRQAILSNASALPIPKPVISSLAELHAMNQADNTVAQVQQQQHQVPPNMQMNPPQVIMAGMGLAQQPVQRVAPHMTAPAQISSQVTTSRAEAAPQPQVLVDQLLAQVQTQTQAQTQAPSVAAAAVTASLISATPAAVSASAPAASVPITAPAPAPAPAPALAAAFEAPSSIGQVDASG